MDVTVIAVVILAVGLIAYTFLGTGGPQQTMFSPLQLVRLAKDAGFQGTDAATAAAIALAESGGDASALGDWILDGISVAAYTDGAVPTSIGLWQIHYTVHPEFDQNSLTNPTYNAEAAYILFSRRGNFTDWSTYNSGKYQAFVSQVSV
jgi:hypothetical protein